MAKTKELQTLEAEKQEVATVEGTERTRTSRVYVPRVDIYETNDAIVILAGLPGVDETSVDISLEKNVLSINGTVESEKPENYTLAFAEYEVGNYERSFTLSDEIDREKIEATVKEGVLQITIPKQSRSVKKIEVKAK